MIHFHIPEVAIWAALILMYIIGLRRNAFTLRDGAPDDSDGLPQFLFWL